MGSRPAEAICDSRRRDCGYGEFGHILLCLELQAQGITVSPFLQGQAVVVHSSK